MKNIYQRDINGRSISDWKRSATRNCVVPVQSQKNCTIRRFEEEEEEENVDNVRTIDLDDSTSSSGSLAPVPKRVSGSSSSFSYSSFFLFLLQILLGGWLSKLKIHEIQGLAGEFLSAAECLNYQPVVAAVAADGRGGRKNYKEKDPSLQLLSPGLRRGFEKASHAGEFCEGESVFSAVQKKATGCRDCSVERSQPLADTAGGV